VLVATDILSEGQNLQDCSIVVNFDLPWAIIRLIQRAGRVDRIGQQAANIRCYTFLPAEGVERIINLRDRVRRRLQENAEVIGTDEAFFEDDRNDSLIRDLFTEKSGILEGEADSEVDLASHAYQIWKNAITLDPALQKIIPNLPPVVFSSKRLPPNQPAAHEGVLVYMRTTEDNDALAWVDRQGRSITESQLTILNAARCEPTTPAQPRHEQHHALVKKGIEHLITEETTIGGQLGRPTGARFRTYERLKRYAALIKGQLWDTPDLHKAIEDIYRFPLREAAKDSLNRQLRSGISDQQLAELVVNLREEDRLNLIEQEAQAAEPQIICSLGLIGS
jgi:hypothetical protein